MSPYELLEHTADAKFRATGRTLEEAFASAVEGMTAIVADPKLLRHTKQAAIKVAGKSLQSLLFNLLDEILFLHDTEKLLPALARDLVIAERNGSYELSAILVGDDARQWGGNLKAVTYSEMLVEQRDGGWLLQAVIDI